MKKLISLMSATTMMISGASLAWADSKIQSTIDITPESKLTEQEKDSVQLAATRLLMHVEQARQDLKKKEIDAAKKNVEQALLISEIIKSVMPTYKIKSEIKAGTNEYTDESEVKPLLVTLKEDLGEIAVLEPIRSAKRAEHLKATKPEEQLAEVEFIESTALLDVHRATMQLEAAKIALATNNTELADKALNRVQSDVDFEYATAELPMTQPGSTRKSAARNIHKGTSKHEKTLESSKSNRSTSATTTRATE